MSLYVILESILNEATTKEIYDKYYKDIDYNIFLKIISADPRTNLQKNKMGSFSKLLLKIYKQNNLRLEDLPKATEYLDVIYKRNLSIKINEINDLSDLYALVKTYVAQDSGKLKDILPLLKTNEYQKLLDGKKWEIYTPATEKAACYLGVNTEWCTQWGKHSLNPKHRDRTNQFHRYSNDKLYIIIDKEDESKKFQFHFPSNQFMNVNDKQINLRAFLDDEEEIKAFFYPSLFNNELYPSDNEINRLEYLDVEDSLRIMKKVVGTTQNKLAIAYITNNEEELSKLTNTENPPLMDNGIVEFEISGKGLRGDVNYLEETYKYFKSTLNQPYESDEYDNEAYDTYLSEYFNEYYKRNKNELSKSYGIMDFEMFEDSYYQDFIKDDNLENEISYIYGEKAQQKYHASVEDAISEIEKYIIFDTGYWKRNTVSVKGAFFLKFLIDENIENISDLNDILNKYIYHYDISSHVDGYDLDYYGGEMPSYDEIENEINKYFENILENDDNTGCMKLRLELSNIFKNIFKSKREIENQIAYVKIYPETLECEDGSVRIDFRNKQTNEKFSGKVKIENITNYINNYQLFESIIKFKKLI